MNIPCYIYSHQFIVTIVIETYDFRDLGNTNWKKCLMLLMYI